MPHAALPPDTPITAVLVAGLMIPHETIDVVGDATVSELYTEHVALLRVAVGEYDGRELKATGDRLVVAFSNAASALRCAIAMHQALDDELKHANQLRIGVDAVRPSVMDGELVGEPIRSAERLCDMASNGQIIASDAVCRLAGRPVETWCAPLRPASVAGLGRPLQAMVVRWWEAKAGESFYPALVPLQATRVLIVDDQRLVRAGFRAIVEYEADMTVIGEGADGREAIELARRLAPDVILMDIRMPGIDGLQAARQIVAETASRVLVLTTFDADEYVYEALRAGASGFLLKDAPGEQLVSAIRSIAVGDALIDPSITRRLIERFARAARPRSSIPEPLRELTTRELDVLRLIARGLSNGEIAAKLCVEETTIKTHVGRILMKLGLRDRVQAVVSAYEWGFVTPQGGEPAAPN
jgi:DNA-binding NarL/FixJ family response regulator